MVILGIDPGIATVGFGVIEAERASVGLITYGAITTTAGQALAPRLTQIYADAVQLIEKFKPDAISVEELFFSTNLKTGISVAHGRGVLLLAGYSFGIPLSEYTPLQVKQAVTGYGKADKKQVMEMVRRLLRMDRIPKPDDAADALAVAICHARSATSLLGQIGGDDTCSTT